MAACDSWDSPMMVVTMKGPSVVGAARMSPVVLCSHVGVMSMPALVSVANAAGQTPADAPLLAQIDRLVPKVQEQIVAWRRDLHEHPELSNREVRTAGVVADHLRKLGLDVRTQVAHTSASARPRR